MQSGGSDLKEVVEALRKQVSETDEACQRLRMENAELLSEMNRSLSSFAPRLLMMAILKSRFI